MRIDFSDKPVCLLMTKGHVISALITLESSMSTSPALFNQLISSAKENVDISRQLQHWLPSFVLPEPR